MTHQQNEIESVTRGGGELFPKIIIFSSRPRAKMTVKLGIYRHVTTEKLVRYISLSQLSPIIFPINR